MPSSKFVYYLEQHIIASLYDALNDEDAKIRMFCPTALEIASRERDQRDVDSSIEPQVKGRLGRAETMKARATAWEQVVELSQALRSRIFTQTLLGFLTHHVLSVRMSLWEAVARAAPVRGLKECREEEERFHQAVLDERAKRQKHAESEQVWGGPRFYRRAHTH